MVNNILEIKLNEKNFKSRKKFDNDVDLNNLLSMFINFHDIEGITSFIRLMFYSLNKNDYEGNFLSFIGIYPESSEYITEIYEFFSEWRPYENYNLGELRGAFLELLLYKLLKEKYDENNIYRESYVLIGNYQSHTWDIIIDLTNQYLFYECKFSVNSLKRGRLNQIFGLKNKINYSVIFLVFFQLSNEIQENMGVWIEDTLKEKFYKQINEIKIISIEDLSKKF